MNKKSTMTAPSKPMSAEERAAVLDAQKSLTVARNAADEFEILLALFRAAARDAREDERERCAKECLRVWHDEADNTTRNGLSHGCIASASAIRALPLEEE